MSGNEIKKNLWSLGESTQRKLFFMLPEENKSVHSEI